MQYADTEYPVISFSRAVRMHNISGILLTISYLLFFFGNMFTKNGKHYRLKMKGITKQVRYYVFGVFKGEKPPFIASKENKFNPLQQLTYLIVMYIFLPLLIISGWIMLFPELIVTQIYSYSGLTITAVFHSAIGFLISIFLIIHIYFATFGATITSNFRGMFSGFHRTPE